MTKARYRWKDKSRVKLSAQIVGEELERLRTQNNGRLTPALVLDEAKIRTSKLHGAFEWRNDVAGEKYRLDQASYLIRHIEVEIVVEKAARHAVRGFVSVQRDQDRSYTSLAHVLSEKDLRVQLVEQAWSDLRSWRNKYGHLTEMRKIVAAIDEVSAGEKADVR